jgi:hypothetical protein
MCRCDAMPRPRARYDIFTSSASYLYVGHSLTFYSSLPSFIVAPLSLTSPLAFIRPFQQDASPQARALLLRKLPSNLRTRIDTRYQYLEGSTSGASSPTRDENVYWHKVGAASDLTNVMQSEMAKIVKGPATMQGLKGLVSAGLGKSLRYGAEKVGKWWTAKSS